MKSISIQTLPATRQAEIRGLDAFAGDVRLDLAVHAKPRTAASAVQGVVSGGREFPNGERPAP